MFSIANFLAVAISAKNILAERTASTGLTGQDSQDGTARKEQQGQDSQNRRSTMGLPGRREERGKDSHDRTANTEQFLGELAVRQIVQYTVFWIQKI